MFERQEIRELLRKIHFRGLPCYPLLVVFFTGRGGPPNCIPMLRVPEPDKGFIFDEDFCERVREATIVNESAHDGAVVFGRPVTSALYRCIGWSYRIIADWTSAGAEANRGAAYNSAISLSQCSGVDWVCLFSRSELEVFRRGEPAFLEVNDRPTDARNPRSQAMAGS